MCILSIYFYFYNDYQAEEFWDQCKAALDFNIFEDDDDSFDYIEQYLQEYYYAMFLDRDDPDESIYDEYRDRADKIFEKIHSTEMRIAFLSKALNCSVPQQLCSRRFPPPPRLRGWTLFQARYSPGATSCSFLQ